MSEKVLIGKDFEDSILEVIKKAKEDGVIEIGHSIPMPKPFDSFDIYLGESEHNKGVIFITKTKDTNEKVTVISRIISKF